MRISLILLALLLIFSVTVTGCSDDKEGDTTESTEQIDATTESDEGADSDSEEPAEEPEEEAVDVSTFPKISAPNGYTEMTSTTGDLDKDGVPEKIVVYSTGRRAIAQASETGDEYEAGTERELRIYKAGADSWELWKSSTGVIQGSEANGPEGGEPFEKISVERGALVIRHQAEADAQTGWDVRRFRWQNGSFELIGVTSGWHAPCMSREEFDYNLSTGKGTFRYEEEECHPNSEQMKSRTTMIDETFTKKLSPLPTMENYEMNQNKVDLPFSVSPEADFRRYWF